MKLNGTVVIQKVHTLKICDFRPLPPAVRYLYSEQRYIYMECSLFIYHLFPSQRRYFLNAPNCDIRQMISNGDKP